MKIENPLLFGIMAVIILGGIFFLQSGKAAPGPINTINNSPNGNSISSSDSLPTPNGPTAPELQGISGYINTTPGLKLADLRGKVVLVDFWTYSCINCIRTQPYLNAWYDAYADKGLVIVGVHTPEFEFEKKLENVQAAVEREEIQYPVVLDNDYSTWRAYKNQYWPRKYLIDAQGIIRYDHIGEGAYEETEAEIQKLLAERGTGTALTGEVSDDIDAQNSDTDFSKIDTPEIYLGYQFARAPLANSENFRPDEEVAYTLPSTLPPNQVALAGTWLNKPDYMELVSDTGKIKLTYSAKNINMVASGPGELRATFDGTSLSRSWAIDEEKLYPIIEGTEYGTHTIELDVLGKGFRIYTFTFG